MQLRLRAITFTCNYVDVQLHLHAIMFTCNYIYVQLNAVSCKLAVMNFFKSCFFKREQNEKKILYYSSLNSGNGQI